MHSKIIIEYPVWVRVRHMGEEGEMEKSRGPGSLGLADNTQPVVMPALWAPGSTSRGCTVSEQDRPHSLTVQKQLYNSKGFPT